MYGKRNKSRSSNSKRNRSVDKASRSNNNSNRSQLERDVYYLKKQVKAQRPETKVTNYDFSTTSIIVSNDNLTAASVANPTFNTLAIGTGPDQRIGNTISNCRFIFRYQLSMLNDPNSGTNEVMQFGRVIVIQMRGIPNAGSISGPPTPPPIEDVLSMNSNTIDDIPLPLLPFQDGCTKLFKIVYDKCHKMCLGASSAVVCKKNKFKIDDLVWTRLDNSGTDQYPAACTNPVFCYFIIQAYTNSTVSRQVLPFSYFRLVYTDA